MLQSIPSSLNSKGEFGRCEIPRLVIEEDCYKTKMKELEDKKKEEEDDRKWKDLVERVSKGNAGKKRRTSPSSSDPPPKRMKSPPETQATYIDKVGHIKLSSSPPENPANRDKHMDLTEKERPRSDMRKPVNIQTITDYPAQKKGGRGRRKNGEEIQVMAVKPIKEHFRKLANKEKFENFEGGRGVEGTPKRKERCGIISRENDLASPAKRRKLTNEKLHTFWTAKSKPSDTNFVKQKIITKPCHNPSQTTELSQNESQD